MADIRYVNWDGLVYYDSKIKEYVDENIRKCIRMGGYVDFKTLPDPTYETLNFIYKVIDEFNTTSDFVTSDIKCSAGTWVQVIETEDGLYLYDIFNNSSITSSFEDTLTYLTPEMFGAFGDGTTDDTQYLKNAIMESKRLEKDLIGKGTYKISDTLIVDSGEKNIELRSIIFESSDKEKFAIQITRASTGNGVRDLVFKTNSIVSNSGGIQLYNSVDEALDYFTLDIGSIKSFYHALSFDCYDNGIQCCNVNIGGVVAVLKDSSGNPPTGHAINFNIDNTDNISTNGKRWIGEVKFTGGHIYADGIPESKKGVPGSTSFALYGNGYSQAQQCHLTSLRFVNTGFEQSYNGIYLKEAQAISFINCRFEHIHKSITSTTVDDAGNKTIRGGIVLEGYANEIKFEGYSIAYEDIDISGIEANVGIPPQIEFDRIRLGYKYKETSGVPSGSAFVGADHRLKIRPYGRVHDRQYVYFNKDIAIGTQDEPKKLFDCTKFAPREVTLYAGTYVEIDSSYDFFGDCKLIVKKVNETPVSVNELGSVVYTPSIAPVNIYYRLQQTNKLVHIATIEDEGMYRLDNYFASLETSARKNPYSLWKVDRLGDINNYDMGSRVRTDYGNVLFTQQDVVQNSLGKFAQGESLGKLTITDIIRKLLDVVNVTGDDPDEPDTPVTPPEGEIGEIIQEIIEKEAPIYSQDSAGSLVKTAFDYNVWTEAEANVQMNGVNTFYQIVDANNNVIQSGYNESTDYAPATLKVALIDSINEIEVHQYDALSSKWKKVENFVMVKSGTQNIDGYTIWEVPEEYEQLPGSTYRFVIIN